MEEFAVFIKRLKVNCPMYIDDDEGQAIFHHVEHLVNDAVYKLGNRVKEYDNRLSVVLED